MTPLEQLRECNMTIELWQVAIRGMLLVLVSAGGMLSIYLGWRLYRDAVISRTTGALETGTLKLRVSTASPGIVLAGFGAYLLTLVATHQFKSNTEISVPTNKPTVELRQTPKTQTDSVTVDGYGSPLNGRNRYFLASPLKASAQDSKVKPPSTATVGPAGSFDCFIYKYKHTTENSVGDDSLSLEKVSVALAGVLDIVQKSSPSSAEEVAAQRRALRVLAELKLMTNDTMAAEQEGLVK